MSNEYLDRAKCLSQIVSNDNVARERISEAFKMVYEKNYFSKELTLRKGLSHRVILLNHVVVDPQGNRPVHLALRLRKNSVYCYDPERSVWGHNILMQELSRYSDAYYKGLNPPYFVGIATTGEFSELMKSSRPRLAGVLTEDVTEGGLHSLKPERHPAFFQRMLANGKQDRVFLDPDELSRHSDYGENYFDEVMVDL